MPGWPTPAFCTASIDSVRMVSIESCSISELGKRSSYAVASHERNGYAKVAAPARISSLSAVSASSSCPVASAATTCPARR